MAFAAAVTMVSCGSKGGSTESKNGNSANPTDEGKTKLVVFTYKAGYGDEWLKSLVASFEKAYADYQFEEGKKGVSVEVRGDMRGFTTAQMKESIYDVFFFENEAYYNFLDGTLEDLSSIVNAKAGAGDSLTVLEKLDSQQTDYYGVKENGKTSYYGLPSYIGNYGIIYNIDLFDKKGYYLAADRTNGVIIGADKNAKRTNGPDGKYGTEDDGLPATYDEFFDLCAEIYNNSDLPICWPGKYRQHHLGNLLDNLVSDYEGVEQMRLNYTFDGTAKDLVVLDANGKVKRDANGTPVTEEKAITAANGYDVARQAGKLYGMEFIEKLMSNSKYYNDGAFVDSFTHTDNQELFLMNGTELSETRKTTAMLIDGPWWMAESSGVFEAMAKEDEKYSEKNRNFGWMPLPKATADKVGSKNVFSDYLNAFVCVKSGLADGVKKAALELVKYSCTDEMLRDFTRVTGTVKGYKYDMTKEDMAELSTFSKSVISAVKKSDVVYKFSSDSFYNSHLANLAYDVVYSTKVGGNTYKNVVDGIKEGGTTGVGYFESYVKYFSDYSFWNA